MASRVRPINMMSFTGGLNMRADAFELGDGESPDMLNVDVDPRGGFVVRRGWTAWNPTAVTGTWNPRSLFVHELTSGTDRLWMANNNLLYHGTANSFTKLQIAAVDVVADASPHGADFAPWGDELFVACGRNRQAVYMNSSNVGTLLTAGAAATWTAYATPSSTVMPKADLAASHAGYVFVASTNEDSVAYPNRIRWSHPNNPKAWMVDDYLDILEGGGKITGLVPMRDHILVFKQSAVWAIYGYDSATWQLVNVSRERGAVSRQAIARSENAVYFYSHLSGIYAIADGNAPQEVSLSLRPMFTDGNFSATYGNSVWLGWLGDRLYFSAPYSTTSTANEATTIFVFDPAIGNGAWMIYRGSDGLGLGPYAQGGFAGGAGLRLGCARSAARVMIIDNSDTPVDEITGVAVGFASHYVTPWVDGGFPTLKKSWRRPDFVMKEREQQYNVTVAAYRDYDEANAVRSKIVSVDAGGTGSLYGTFLYGSGVLYAASAKGSRIERGGNLGSARSIQLRISGDATKPWGVDAIVFKMIPRRLR